MSDNIPNERDISESLCSEIRQDRKNGLTYQELDAEYILDIEDIIRHIVGTCDCNNTQESSIDPHTDQPYKNEYVAQKLRREKEMQFTVMGRIMGVHPETAKKYVDKYNISRVDSSDRTSSPTVNKLLGMNEDDIEIGLDEK